MFSNETFVNQPAQATACGGLFHGETIYPAGFKGHAKRLTDIGVARVGRLIGVGEDEVRAVMEVEAAGGGFDKLGRPKMLFEPHRFWTELAEGPKRTLAADQGLAYPSGAQSPTRPTAIRA